jgi:hypothetical protein
VGVSVELMGALENQISVAAADQITEQIAPVGTSRGVNSPVLSAVMSPRTIRPIATPKIA